MAVNVLFIASEAAPFVKTGGLADVMGALPAALRKQGVKPALVLPCYAGIAEEYKKAMQTVYTGQVDLSWRNQYLGVKRLELNGIPVYFIDNEYYFKRESLYGYGDDAERFAYFAKAVLAMLPHIDFKPAVLHTNDWHTGMVGAYLKEDFMQDPFYQGMKTVYTIHNLKYQGIFGKEIVEDVLGLPLRLLYNGNIENAGNVNFMKAGMYYADFITTVSRTYAEEIKYAYFGEGLEDYVSLCAGKLSGILNGLDEAAYDPATDPYLSAHFTAENVFTHKPLDKEALQKELGLKVNRETPLLALVTRLVEAKGLDLLIHIMDELMQEEVQLVVVGTGDKEYAEALQALDRRHPDRVSINILFDEGLARRVYAGADLFLMPSRYEACGLSQMIAMRYGTIPVVRETGGLKDSVKNFEKFSAQDGNGLSFVNFNAHELLFTVKRGLSYFAEKPVWEKLVVNAMKTDNSWDKSAREYAMLYTKIYGQPETPAVVPEADILRMTEKMLQTVQKGRAKQPPAATGKRAKPAEAGAVKKAGRKSQAQTPAEEKIATRKQGKADRETVRPPKEQTAGKGSTGRKTTEAKKNKTV